MGCAGIVGRGAGLGRGLCGCGSSGGVLRGEEGRECWVHGVVNALMGQTGTTGLDGG